MADAKVHNSGSFPLMNYALNTTCPSIVTAVEIIFSKTFSIFTASSLFRFHFNFYCMTGLKIAIIFESQVLFVKIKRPRGPVVQHLMQCVFRLKYFSFYWKLVIASKAQSVQLMKNDR